MKVKLSNHDCLTSKCKIKRTDSNIVLDAKGKSYVMDNSIKRIISRYDLDDCVFSGKQIGKLCDKVIITHVIINNVIQEKDYVWLEFKGSDLNQACKQLFNSYNNAIDYNDSINHFARVVLSKVNKKDESKDYVKRIKKQFRNRFDYSSTVYNKDRSDKLYLKSK